MSDSAVRDALSDLSMAVTTRALRGRDHVPSMRNEQRALAKAHAALSAKPTDVTDDAFRAGFDAGWSQGAIGDYRATADEALREWRGH